MNLVNQNYEYSVKDMFQLHDLMHEMSKMRTSETFDELVSKDLEVSRANKKLEDYISNLAKDPEEFMKFAFELRK